MNSWFSAFTAALSWPMRRLLEQPLARLQGAGGFGGQFLRGCGRGRGQIAVGHHAGHEAEFGCPRRRKRRRQQEHFRRPEMADTRWYREARTELRHQAQIDERQLELRALARVDEIAVRQHRGAASDRSALHGRDDRLSEPDKGVHQAGLRGFARLLGFEEILDVVTGAERISGGLPQHDTDSLVLVGLVEEYRQGACTCRRSARSSFQDDSIRPAGCRWNAR